MRSLKQIIKDIFKPRNGLQALKEMLPPRPLVKKFVEDLEAAKSKGYEKVGTVYWDHMDEPYSNERTAIYYASKRFHIPENLVVEFLDIRFVYCSPNPDCITVLARRIS